LFGQSSGDPTVPVIVRFLTPPGQAERDAVTSTGGTVTRTYTLVNAAAVKITAAGKDKLKANGLVAAVEDDLPIRLHDAELDNTWGVKQINAGLVHDAGNTGVGVKVCVLDTGIDTTHSELSANYKGGYNFVNGTATPTDDNGHGTHTSGTIAAIMNAANVRGAAPQVDLYAYKILDASGNGYASSIISALQECVKVGGKVTNNSYGASSDLGSTVQSAFDNAKAAGVINVASAGNSGAGANTVGYPAQYSSVIAVAATDSANNWASFSSTGPAVAVAAPGVSILSTYPTNSYASMSGTSMADAADQHGAGSGHGGTR
jgi:subtilisin